MHTYIHTVLPGESDWLTRSPSQNLGLAREYQNDSIGRSHGTPQGIWLTSSMGQRVREHPKRKNRDGGPHGVPIQVCNTPSRWCCQSQLVPSTTGSLRRFEESTSKNRVPWGQVKNPAYSSVRVIPTPDPIPFFPNLLWLPPDWLHNFYILSFCINPPHSVNVLLTLLICYYLTLHHVPSYWFYQT